jgi:hypothetical protein
VVVLPCFVSVGVCGFCNVYTCIVCTVFFCVVSLMCMFPYLVCPYCHRVTTELQLIIITMYPYFAMGSFHSENVSGDGKQQGKHLEKQL